MRIPGEEEVTHGVIVRIAEKDPKCTVVPRRQGGVRFGIVGVVGRIKDNSNDKRLDIEKSLLATLGL